MYDIPYKSTHSQLQFRQKKVSKSRIHILPNYEQKDSKTAIVSRAEICLKFGGFLGDFMTPKLNSEIN